MQYEYPTLKCDAVRHQAQGRKVRLKAGQHRWGIICLLLSIRPSTPIISKVHCRSTWKEQETQADWPFGKNFGLAHALKLNTVTEWHAYQLLMWKVRCSWKPWMVKLTSQHNTSWVAKDPHPPPQDSLEIRNTGFNVSVLVQKYTFNRQTLTHSLQIQTFNYTCIIHQQTLK